MITACICTYNPDRGYLRRCLVALREQQLPPGGAELVVVDNASKPPLTVEELGLADWLYPVRLVVESRQGRVSALERGVREARGSVVISVDDDNVLAPDYLVQVERFFATHPAAGVAGGRIRPIVEIPLPEWFKLAERNLAIRDLGGEAYCQSAHNWDAPPGAGMAARRELLLAAFQWPLLMKGSVGDRRSAKNNLSSGEDTELCHRIRRFGHEIWYDPALELSHLLLNQRLTEEYQYRLTKQFGLNQPYLELYERPDLRWRRWFYLRRARVCRRTARAEERRAAAATDVCTQFAAKQNAVFEAASSASYWRLATGPAIWNDIERSIAEARRSLASGSGLAHQSDGTHE